MENSPGTSSGRRRGHNEGSIHKRKDGRWVAAMTIGGPRRKAFYGRARPEAAARLAAAMAELAKGQAPSTNERQTVGQFLTCWLEDTAKPGVRAATFRGYEGKIRTHILPGLGQIPLVKLTPQRLWAFLNQKRGAGLAPPT